MTGAQWLLLGEGDADVVFLYDLLQDLGLTSVEVQKIGGDYTRLASDGIQNLIRRAAHLGQRVAIVLDADSDIADTRSGYEDIVEEKELPIERVFFIPNDADSGRLEDLLEELVADDHRCILDCFEEYEECLSTTNPEYATPDKKAKIYAYCEAVGDQPKEKERNYLNRSWWNLDAAELDPLRRFLQAL